MNSARIPVVDLSSPSAAHELLDAACKYGFIYVKHKDLNISPTDVDDMFDLSREFFASDVSNKEPCTINSAKSGKNHGWLSMHTETLDPARHKRGDFKEAFNIGEYIDGKPQQPFPETFVPHEKRIGDFQTNCHALCVHVLKLLAQALEIDPSSGGSDWFAARHNGPSGSVLRLLYYPMLPPSVDFNAEKDIRAGAHSDYGSVTLLFRLPGQPGLEIVTPSGEWAAVPVDPAPGSDSEVLPILVNIGDLMSYWTNGLLKSTIHRVVFPPASGGAAARERYSIAYFCHPMDSAELSEIPSERVKALRGGVTESNETGSKVLTARDHLNSRLQATYGIKT